MSSPKEENNKDLELLILSRKEVTGVGTSSNNNNTESSKPISNDDIIINEPQPQPQQQPEQTHAYKRRFFILALFCAHSAINSFQWIQYSSITNVISAYYGASNLQVNLTSLVYMITYIPFIIQASLLLERVGLRKAVVLGTLGTALGSLVKWLLGGQPTMSSFWWMMLGQTIVALSQLFIISIPPLLAAIWFPDNQVSTATGIGVFGNQLGIALGFIIPPWIIGDVEVKLTDFNKADLSPIYGTKLNSLACIVVWFSFLICIISILAFKDKPPKPPGSASLHAQQEHNNNNNNTNEHQLISVNIEQEQVDGSKSKVTEPENIDAYASIKELSLDKDFRYLVLSYGINVGVFYAISTVLNQMVELGWSDQVSDLVGKMGLLIVVSGMLGSIVCGQLLDRTHAYKLTIVIIYLFSLLSMLLFAIILKLNDTEHTWPLYLASIILGFFMTGYLPLGFEFAAEITYPHPANTPAGLLNLSAQVFGLILTYSSSLMVDKLGNLWANGFLTFCLAIGLILTLIMKANLRRQQAVADEKMKI